MQVSDCPTEKLLIEPLIVMDMVVVVERNLLTLWIFIETLILFISSVDRDFNSFICIQWRVTAKGVINST